MTISVSCINYGPKERVRIYWGSPSGTSVASFISGTDGTGGASFTVPTVPGGGYTIYVVGARNNAAIELAFTVKPSMSISPTSGTVGTRFTITLAGFQAGETVSIKWYVTSTSTKTIAKGIVVGSDGTVRVTVKVPTDKPATHKVAAIGNQGSSVSGKFQLTAS
jgi:hypothetical protein